MAQPQRALQPKVQTKSRKTGSIHVNTDLSRETSTAQALPLPDRQEIAALAYSYWVARGDDGGSAEDDWLRAERELKVVRTRSAQG